MMKVILFKNKLSTKTQKRKKKKWHLTFHHSLQMKKKNNKIAFSQWFCLWTWINESCNDCKPEITVLWGQKYKFLSHFHHFILNYFVLIRKVLIFVSLNVFGQRLERFDKRKKNEKKYCFNCNKNKTRIQLKWNANIMIKLIVLHCIRKL